MASGSDGQREISEERLCEIAGVKRSTRRNWARIGLLNASRPGYDEQDAIELAVLDRLKDRLGATDAPIAWRQIRDSLQHHLDAQEVDVVFDAQHKEAFLLTEAMGLEPARLRHGRPVQVVFLSDAIRDIRAAFNRITA